MTTTLDRYRTLVPAHASVPDATISAWLESAYESHYSSAWGAVYEAAMIAWAASRIEPLRLQGVAGEVGGPGSVCAPPPTAAGGKPLPPVKPEDTPYWAWYVQYRDSRVATAPRSVPAWP